MEQPLSSDQLQKMHAYWPAANYLSVGQIYLKDNPLLERPLTIDDIKPRLLGHWGTTPGLNVDMCVLNDLDRYRLTLDAIMRVPRLSHLVDEAHQRFTEARQKHKLYVSQYGEDMPEVRNWRWSGKSGADSTQDTGGDNV